MKLYNTLSRKLEDFKPINSKKVGVYSCGPTVYWYQHIGNLRTYIFSDILRRVLEYKGYKVKQIMNVTDVGHLTSDADTGEDKMEKAAKKEGKKAADIANHYWSIFREDFKKEKTANGIISIKYVTCIIKGKVRKSSPKASLEYIILNAPNLNSRTQSFYHEEQLYIYFKSPVEGFISIFLEDEDAVYRLLPYINMRDNFQSGVPIQSDTDYLFFSPDNNPFPNQLVDEPSLLTLKKDIEYNYLYIIFSEDEFVKPMLENSVIVNERIIPKQLSINKFQRWLANNRAFSENFQDIRVKVSIEPEKY